MKKRFFSLALALVMVLALLPFGALAAQVITEGPLVFTVENGKATVTACTAEADVQKVVIPASVQGVPVTGVGFRAFAGSFVESVVFPDSLESIDRFAFLDAFVTRLDLSHTKLADIPQGTFSGCQMVAELLLPETLREIGEESFQNCHALKTLTIPDAVVSIGAHAFSYCDNLETVTFPAGLQTIGDYAFENCSSLDQVVLPRRLASIGDSAFSHCDHLTDILLPDSVTHLGEHVFSFCYRLQEIRIPTGLREIPHDCFRDCAGLTVVLIPGTVTSIATTAFDFCYALKEIYFSGTEAQLLSAIQLDYVTEYSGLANDQLQIYLMDGYPDAYYWLYDMPEEDNWAYDGIAFCLDNGLMQGVGNGLFKPYDTTTRAQLVTILWRMCGEPKATKPLPFTDCGISWADPAIAWASENGIVSGVGAGKFGPGQPITREQLVTIFYRFCREYLDIDVSARQSISAYPDAKDVSAWASDAMQWGIAVKLISGVASAGGTLLQPGGSATRAQIARIILNFVTNVAPAE